MLVFSWQKYFHIEGKNILESDGSLKNVFCFVIIQSNTRRGYSLWMFIFVWL